jgi:predicted permease
MVSYWMIRAIALITFRGESARLLPMLRMSPLVFAFAAGVAALCAVLFGLMPAFRTIRFSPGEMLKSAASTSGASHGEGRNRLGRSLVAAEVAIALVLVVGAGLALRTLVNLETVNTGFRKDHVLTVDSYPTSGQLLPERSVALARTILERLGALPTVERATWAGGAMGIGDLWRTDLKIVEHPELDYPGGNTMSIGPQYFETLEIPVLAGRGISVADTDSNAHFVWINKAFADKFFKGINPIGLHAIHNKITYEIVGIVGNTKFQTVADNFEPGFFLTQDNGGYFSFELRTAGNPEALEAPVREIFARTAPEFLITQMQPLQAAIDDNLYAENALARLFSGFGALALGLAALGVYGVLAYSVSRRTSEIAIRMSLGAMPADILRLVVKEGLLPAAVGSAAGIVGAWAATRLVGQFLYRVKPLDPITFAASAGILMAVAIVACLAPARRAMRVVPMVALRYE